MRKPPIPSNKIVGLIFLTLASLQGADAQTSTAMDLINQSRSLTPDAKHGEILYLKHCTGCHGRHAWGDGPKAMPALAGQQEFYIVEQLAAFVTRERDSSLMLESTHPADVDRPQAFRDLAAHLSQAPKSTAADHGDGRAAAAGAKIYAHRCAVCHGKSGEGNVSGPIPAIGGQQYDYLLGQLGSFAVRHRAKMKPPDANLAAGLSTEEQEDVAAYVSRMNALIATE